MVERCGAVVLEVIAGDVVMRRVSAVDFWCHQTLADEEIPELIFLQIVGGCVAVLMVVLMSVMFRYVRQNPEKFKYDVPSVCSCLHAHVRV